MSKNKFAALAEKVREENADTPAPVSVAIASLSPTALAQSKPSPAPKAKEAGELREKTSITLTPGAAAALRRLQGFLLVECDAGGVPAAAAVNLALELAAGGLPGNRKELLQLLEEHRQGDKRRKIKA